MRVKRLEIQGFKSFKDKTVIHFDHTITGIVGPNGSGKSNIVDAFFWVMGEQSYKHMRGSSSDDLIFNGSSRYSPMGMAEATLVLETDVVDNSSAPAGASASSDLPVHLRQKEISVTRRLYRSGEGEYFINGVPSRLKDIHELFMDTGVGTKGYSVIEQGQIGKIVQSKPEERRLLIEEAAGIAKYKARKKESLRKMEATQGNLSRLNDVLAEIERNVGSLERQAQKARQYKKYKDELFEKEITWGRRKAKVFRDKLDVLHKQRDAVEYELVGLRAELQTAENTIETDRVDQVTDTKQAEELQTKIQHLSTELTRQKSALDLSRRRQGDLSQQLDSLERERSDLASSIEIDQEKINVQENEFQNSEEIQTQARAQVETQQATTTAARTQATQARVDIENAKRELIRAISQSSEFTAKNASLTSRIESSQMQSERLLGQIELINEKLSSVTAELEEVRERTEVTRIKRDQLRDERRELQTGIQASEQSLRSLESRTKESDRSLTQLKSRLQSLEELAAAHEGFGDGPKAALEWLSKKGKTAAVALSDVLEVKSGFETALEGWMNGALEHVLLNDLTCAADALAHLRADGLGRATVKFSENFVNTGTSKMAAFAAIQTLCENQGLKVVGQLEEFVKAATKSSGKGVSEAIASLASQSVKNVCVVEAITADALTNAINSDEFKKSFAGWGIVALDGTSLDSQGCLRGGAFDASHATTVLGRKRAIADMTVQVEELSGVQDELVSQLDAAREVMASSKERLQALGEEIQKLEVEVASSERDLHQINRSYNEATSQMKQAQSDLEHTKRQAEQAERERSEFEEELRDVGVLKVELEEKIKAEEASVMVLELVAREQESSLSELKIQEASTREKLLSLKRELEGTKSLLRDRTNRMNEISRTLERASREHSEHSGGDSDIQTSIETMTLDLATFKAGLSQVKDRLEVSGAKLNHALERIKHLHADGDRKMGESSHVALEFERLQGEFNHLLLNLEEKYGPGCLDRPVAAPIQDEMEAPIVTAEMTAEEEVILGEEVEKLRERIRRLGEVNVGAIEEFEIVSKRFEHLTGEKLDLLKSIENLEEAIEHINKTSEERFSKAFEAIATRFEKLFPIVFGGGQAKLSLVYPEGSNDILEAGVEILAQPPGKKISNLSLLSGGEKALTAVSLIFAIFMVKPSPFCLLDEVDAPLDDANIGKFNALLREMSVKSQFILITHNKKTMELNDTLYGVTMEEPGVSKVVSVELH